MKIIRLKKNLTVVLEDGTLLTNNKCTDTLYEMIVESQEDEEAVRCLMVPELCARKEEIELKTEMIENISDSSVLTVKGQSVYMESVSQLTVPEDLAFAIYKAEKEENIEALQSYINFWTLASLNPDSRARTNLFWFLQKYGMHISSSGLFVAYRNVLLHQEGSEIDERLAKFISSEYAKIKFKHKKSPKNYIVCTTPTKELKVVPNHAPGFTWDTLGTLEEMYQKLGEESAPVYTDQHSRKFRIKIGEVVSMDRSKCDPVQENTCSTGLHVAGMEWLQANYFGSTSLQVLVNPTDVVAVPPRDGYGKMRVCAYYPVQVVDRDEDGHIIDPELSDGFEDDFMTAILYEGDINNVDDGNYDLIIPQIPELNRVTIAARLKDIKLALEDKVLASYYTPEEESEVSTTWDFF